MLFSSHFNDDNDDVVKEDKKAAFSSSVVESQCLVVRELDSGW